MLMSRTTEVRRDLARLGFGRPARRILQALERHDQLTGLELASACAGAMGRIMGHGQLYDTIDWLIRAGIVRSFVLDDDPDKLYHLSDRGQRLVAMLREIGV